MAQLLQLAKEIGYAKVAAVGLAIWYSGLLLRRLYFHPLAKIPGPWFARASSWYEWYYDCFTDGYVKQYPRLHAKYGTVVRVAPERVHVSDPEAFHEIYHGSTKYMKDPGFFATSGGITNSVIMLIDPDIHKARRNRVKSIFSQKSMTDVAPIVMKVLRKGLQKMHNAYEKGQAVDMNSIWRAVTVDTIMKVMLDKDLNMIEAEEEEPPFFHAMHMFASNFAWQKHFPILSTIAMNLPDSVATKLLPGYIDFRKQCGEWVEEVQERHKNGVYTAEDGRPTIFDLLLQADPEKENIGRLDKEVLIDEMFAFCFAGTDTTSYALSQGTFQLLSHPDKLKKLQEELSTVSTNAEGLYEHRDIVNLPYLSACIKEILRMSTPVPGVTPRIVPEGGVKFGEHYIPAGSSISIAMRMINYNPDLWEDPDSYIPERWMGKNSAELEKWFVTFSKGPRMCLGINMSYVEMYLCIANLFGKLDMSLYETDEKTTGWMDKSASARMKQNVKVKINGFK